MASASRGVLYHGFKHTAEARRARRIFFGCLGVNRRRRATSPTPRKLRVLCVSAVRLKTCSVQKTKPPRLRARASRCCQIAGTTYFAGAASAALSAFLAFLPFLWAFLSALVSAFLSAGSAALAGSSARTPKETRTNAARAAAIVRIMMELLRFVTGPTPGQVLRDTARPGPENF